MPTPDPLSPVVGGSGHTGRDVGHAGDAHEGVPAGCPGAIPAPSSSRKAPPMSDDITTSPDSDSSGESAAPDDVSDRPAAADADGALNVPAPPDSPDIPVPHPGGPAAGARGARSAGDPGPAGRAGRTHPAVKHRRRTVDRGYRGSQDAERGTASRRPTPAAAVSPSTRAHPGRCRRCRRPPRRCPSRPWPPGPPPRPCRGCTRPDRPTTPRRPSPSPNLRPCRFPHPRNRQPCRPQPRNRRPCRSLHPRNRRPCRRHPRNLRPCRPHPKNRRPCRSLHPRNGDRRRAPGIVSRRADRRYPAVRRRRTGTGRVPVVADPAPRVAPVAALEAGDRARCRPPPPTPPSIRRWSSRSWRTSTRTCGAVSTRTASSTCTPPPASGRSATGRPATPRPVWPTSGASSTTSPPRSHCWRRVWRPARAIPRRPRRRRSRCGIRSSRWPRSATWTTPRSGWRSSSASRTPRSPVRRTARIAARAAAVKAKEALCVEAEALAESTQWKSTGDRLKAIVEEWRTIRGIDRKTDDALWKRFAKARDTFTRHRGSHFAELDKQRGAAKEAKEELIKRAEALSDATEWGETAGEVPGVDGRVEGHRSCAAGRRGRPVGAVPRGAGEVLLPPQQDVLRA